MRDTKTTGLHGRPPALLELAEYNADVNVGEVKDKSHSNVRGLINHLTSAIPAGKVPGGCQAFQAAQDAAFNKWLSLDNRAEAVSDRDNAVETIANRLTQPTPSGQYSPVDMIENEAERQNKTYGTHQVRLTTNNELRGQLPKEESFIDEANIPKKNTTPNEQEAYQFAKHSYWAESAQKHISNVTNVAKVIKDAYDGTFRDSK